MFSFFFKGILFLLLLSKSSAVWSQGLNKISFHANGAGAIELGTKLDSNFRTFSLKESNQKTCLFAFPVESFFVIAGNYYLDILSELFLIETVLVSVDNNHLINNIFLSIIDSANMLRDQITGLKFQSKWGAGERGNPRKDQFFSWITNKNSTIVLSSHNCDGGSCGKFRKTLRLFKSNDPIAAGNYYIIYRCN